MDIVAQAFNAGEDFVKNRVIDLRKKYVTEERTQIEMGIKSSKLRTKISVLDELLIEVNKKQWHKTYLEQ